MLHKNVALHNHKMIMNEVIPEEEKKSLLDSILLQCKTHNYDSEYLRKESAYHLPKFLLPTPEESQAEPSKKIRLITGELPKTSLLSNNAYELEALRLLALWNSDDTHISKIFSLTEERLKHTFFNDFRTDGEYPATTLVALRFWNTFKPHDTERMNSLLVKLIDYISTVKHRSDVPTFYFWLTLSELAAWSEVAREIIHKFSQELYQQFLKGWIVNPNNADRYNPIRKYVIRNALSKLSEYRYMVDAEVYLSDDGRCYGISKPVYERR